MKYLVIGGNAAGMSFASKMRRNDNTAEIVVIETSDYVSFGSCGLPYYIGDKFDDVNEMIIRTPEEFIKQGIDVRINQRVLKVDSAKKSITILSENKEYDEGYDKLILATGAKPIRIKDTDFSDPAIFTLTRKEDGLAIKKELQSNKQIKKIGIIGSGFIGLEIMDTLESIGYEIVLFEAGSTILNDLYDEKVIEPVLTKIKNNKNITIHYKTPVSKIQRKENIISIESNDIVKETVDFVIESIGFRPNTGYIDDLEKLNNGAIKILNKWGQTTKKDVYAIGDCASTWNAILEKPFYLPLATSANKNGRLLAEYLTEKTVEYKGMLGSSALKVLEYEVARTGIPEKDAIKEGLNIKTKIVVTKNYTSYYPGQSDIITKIIYDPDTKKILGAEMCGQSGVVGRIDVLALGILKGLTTEELGYIDFCYAPPFSGSWDSLNIIGNVSK